ncbi:MAG: early nodulin 20 (N-20) [Lachnospiraceae bacterium]|nr:early nodulin 20 (N-20) [Lachnospiraceae bacterium]
MKRTIILKKAIKINGKDVKELTYDFEKISSNLFRRAEMKSIEGLQTMKATVMETDVSLHLALGMAAIIADNNDIDFNDLDRITGVDLIFISRLGRSFTSGSLEEESEESSSEMQSEAIQESITPAQSNWEENQL